MIAGTTTRLASDHRDVVLALIAAADLTRQRGGITAGIKRALALMKQRVVGAILANDKVGPNVIRLVLIDVVNGVPRL